MKYTFDIYDLDTQKAVLTKYGKEQNIPAQVYSILEILIVNRDRIVTKEELIEHIWGGRSISPNSINTRIRDVRAAIGDTGSQQLLVKTFPNRGFRFIGIVKENPDEAKFIEAQPSSNFRPAKGSKKSVFSFAAIGIMICTALLFFLQTAKAPPITTFQTTSMQHSTANPSMIFLPIRSEGARLYSKDFSDALTFELRDILERQHDLTFMFDSLPSDSANSLTNRLQFFKELNIDFVLRGSVRERDFVTIVYLELINLETSLTIWSETIEVVLNRSSLIDFQQKKAYQIAYKITNALNITPPAMVTYTDDPEAYALFIESKITRVSGSSESIADAIKLLLEAIEIDPSFVSAHAELVVLYRMAGYASEMTIGDAQDKMKHHLELGMQINPNHPDILNAAGFMVSETESTMKAISYFDRVLAVRPNDFIALSSKAWNLYQSGFLEEAELAYEEAIKLSPTSVGKLYEFAFLKYDLKKDSEAFEPLNQNIYWYKDSHLSFEGRGRIKQSLGQYVSAYFDYQEALRRAPDDAFSQYGLIVMCVQLDCLNEIKPFVNYPELTSIIQAYDGINEKGLSLLNDVADPFDKLYLAYLLKDKDVSLEVSRKLMKHYGYHKNDRNFSRSDIRYLILLAQSFRINSSPEFEITKQFLQSYYDTHTNTEDYAYTEFEGAIAFHILDDDLEMAVEFAEKAYRKGYFTLNLHKEPLFSDLINERKYQDLLREMEIKANLIKSRFSEPNPSIAKEVE